MKYKIVAFDLDGTLMNTAPGIINCHNEIARKYNLKEIPYDEYLKLRIIGETMPNGFKKFYGVKDENIDEIVFEYGKLYKEKGLEGCIPYDGIKDLLQNLKENGIILAVATSKLETAAIQLLTQHNLIQYFDVVYGADPISKISKSEILKKIQKEFNVDVEEIVLVGDANNDVSSAKKANMDCIGVTYGYGYQNLDEIKKDGCIEGVETVEELKNLLIKFCI